MDKSTVDAQLPAAFLARAELVTVAQLGVDA